MYIIASGPELQAVRFGYVILGKFLGKYTQETVECEKHSSVAVLKSVRLAPNIKPHCLAYSSSEWHTYTIHVSIV
jgi:hypothetical protein